MPRRVTSGTTGRISRVGMMGDGLLDIRGGSLLDAKELAGLRGRNMMIVEKDIPGQ